MRILQVCPGSYISGIGGVSEHVVQISEGLVKRGHDVTVFATNSGALPWLEVKNGVKVKRFKRFAPGKAYFLSPTMFAALRKATDFSLIHAHGFHALPMHFTLPSNSRRLVVTTHYHGAGHSVFRDRLFRLLHPLGKLTLLRAEVIIAVSDFERSLLLTHFNLKKGKVVVIPNGVNLKEFEGIRKRKFNSRSILYVGRLEKYKGVQNLIEILPKLPSDVVLKVVGTGSQGGILEQRAKQLGVNQRLIFYPHLKRSDLLQLYADADLFVLLSQHEAYGLVVAEALTSGLPCVVANTSSLAEWIDNETCFGVDYPIELDKLAKVVLFLLNKKIHRKDFSEKYVNGKILDWKDVVCQLEKVYSMYE